MGFLELKEIIATLILSKLLRIILGLCFREDYIVLGVPSGHRRPDFVPTGSHVARVQERVEAEVKARASWRATRSHVVSKDGASVDPANIEAVTSCPRPFTVSEACEDSFHSLKQKLVTAPILTVADALRSFVIYSDASKKGLGCVLMQQGKTNAVADALNRKVSHSTTLITKHAPFHRDLERVEIAVSVGAVTSQLAQLLVQSTLRLKIIVAQHNGSYLVEKRRLAEIGQANEFSTSSDDGLLF
ncbi:ty3-gypsy retrotransposon protein [Cucumis melo var. makuwa]|uniref:Ty3-gypsy retrotransposon protein n=1 Tax=Cucumis melo var. makuwa TaxID=1194695 RepID=A0A5D3DXQ9_CUCMM|nr:ty3-gypsy retrotransposon protein [Cucumis melo var. makuwa]